jgi:hypothetical protein
MITGRPKPTLTVTTDEPTQLRSLAGSRTLPHAVVAHARLVLRSAGGQSNSQKARRLGWAKATVGDRRRDIETRCVQQERARLLNQDPAQKFFAQMKRQAAELMCAQIFAGCPTRYSTPNSSSNTRNHCIAPVASMLTTTRLPGQRKNSRTAFPS